MNYIKRKLEDRIIKSLNKGKVILIFGARRVGKTMLCKKLAKDHKAAYFNCDLLEVKEMLNTTSRTQYKSIIGNNNFLIFDEAQGIPDIGAKLKILNDEFPEVQILATGSSAFDLINHTSEPLTGRSRSFYMYPLSFEEIANASSTLEANGDLENILRYGLYPEVYTYPEEEKIEELTNIASNYLFKDILMHGNLKRPDLILEILKLIAFQVGSELSLNEISNKTNTSVHTVKHYLEMLEKSYIIFNLPSFSRNLRSEVGKARKYYFFDLGIRNAIIRNYNPLNLRNDIGALWENFCIVERIKYNEYNRLVKSYYFWRNYKQKEIDYIEEYDGALHAYEIKYTKEKAKWPKEFFETYEGSSKAIVTKNNYLEFLM